MHCFESFTRQRGEVLATGIHHVQAAAEEEGLEMQQSLSSGRLVRGNGRSLAMLASDKANRSSRKRVLHRDLIQLVFQGSLCPLASHTFQVLLLIALSQYISLSSCMAILIH